MNKNILLNQKPRIADSCVCCGNKEFKKSPASLMPFIAHRVFDWKPVEITDEWGLKTIKKGMAYSICNSLQCTACGLIFLDIRFNEREMNFLYDGYREKKYVALRDTYEPGYRARNDDLNKDMKYLADVEQFLQPHVRFPVSILNWGGDTGRNTPFKKASKRIHVFDISNKPVVDGATKVSKSSMSRTRYDLIVCSNVLEHVPYPIDMLLDMKKVMTKKTVLYVEVPHENIIRDGGSRKNQLKKKKHWHEHINFFTQKSLEKLLNICGMSIIKLKQLKVSTDNNSARLYNGKVTYIFMIACKLQ